jgi:hypothetical protein
LVCCGEVVCYLCGAKGGVFFFSWAGLLRPGKGGFMIDKLNHACFIVNYFFPLNLDMGKKMMGFFFFKNAST